MTDPVLYQRLQMHARLQGGHLYVYEILDADKPIGTYSLDAYPNGVVYFCHAAIPAA